MMETIQIVQVASKTKLKDIVTLEVVDGTFKQLSHMPISKGGETEIGDVWIDQIDDDSMFVNDETLHITAEKAVWLLTDFFKQPKFAKRVANRKQPARPNWRACGA